MSKAATIASELAAWANRAHMAQYETSILLVNDGLRISAQDGSLAQAFHVSWRELVTNENAVHIAIENANRAVRETRRKLPRDA